MNKPLFELGKVVMTKGLASYFNKIDANKVQEFLHKHVTGDFGQLDKSDIKMNNEAIKTGEDRILSCYEYYSKKIYIITEWDRSYTTIMFAEEY
jgi:hypothetical protein